MLLNSSNVALADAYTPFRSECAARVKWLPFVDQPIAFEYCLKGELARAQAAQGRATWTWMWDWQLWRWINVPIYTH